MRLLKGEEFTYKVMEIVNAGDITFLDAIKTVCENENIDFSNIKRLLTDKLKCSLQEEALRLNLIKE